jgi:hypothetical protein
MEGRLLAHHQREERTDDHSHWNTVLANMSKSIRRIRIPTSMADHGRQLVAQALPKGRRRLQKDIMAFDDGGNDLPLQWTVGC